jgi:ankyrin repeat protein
MPEQVLTASDPFAIAAGTAIRAGDVGTLKQLLADNPGLATARIVSDPRGNCGGGSRTLLHVATDWPGNFPNGPEIVRALIAAGAEVNARGMGSHGETPLHWAASSDDVAVLDALLDSGADIEADGAVIGNGTPIADAAAFGQWKAARRLIERGAKTNLWQSATMGLIDRVREQMNADPTPAQADITNAFWCACHGGQREPAEYLLDCGADLNWIGYDNLTALEAAKRSEAHDVAAWLMTRGAKSAAELA